MFICAYLSASPGRVSPSNVRNEVPESKSVGQTAKEACTPISLVTSKKESSVIDSKKHQTARKIASMVRNPSALKPKSYLQSSQAKKIKQSSGKR